MLKDFLLEKCSERYCQSCAGRCGDACDNRAYCKGACDAEGGCLDQVHYYPGTQGRTDYDCELLLNKYVLRFSERYEKQIFTVLRQIDLSCYDRFEIFSIGCGGAPDLMAFEELTKTTGKNIYYRGFDKNEKWRAIHDSIEDYASSKQMDVRFWREDIFDVFSRRAPSHSYNVVVLQYVLSHLFNISQEGKTSELYDCILNKILPLRNPDSPFIIILCDVDSMDKGRSRWFTLLDKLEEKHYRGRAFAMSYYPNGDLGAERWSNHKAHPTFGNILYQYIQNDSEHDGAKLIIELE